MGFNPSNLFDSVSFLPDSIPEILMPSFRLLPLLDLADSQGDVLAVGQDVQLAHAFS